MADKVQAIVIGAGVVGLAVTRALVRRGKEVLLLEKATQIGSETSSRNSQVIHAGLYYPSSSLKAQLCVRGKSLLYDFCRRWNVAHRACGKLIVATSEEQRYRVLESLRRNALELSVPTSMITNPNEIMAREPGLAGTDLHAALWSPTTGILDVHGFMVSLQADIEELSVSSHSGSATVALSSAVVGGQLPKTTDSSHEISVDVQGISLKTSILINCAGLFADSVARMLHYPAQQEDCDNEWDPPRQYFAKGTYFRLQGYPRDRPAPFNHLIYPVPEQAMQGLGIHASLDVHESHLVRFGPDVEWIDPTFQPDLTAQAANSNFDYSLDSSRFRLFTEAVRHYWSELAPIDGSGEPNPNCFHLVPDYCGIRAKLFHPQIDSSMKQNQSMSHFTDFGLYGPAKHGIPGLVHLMGIESPGLTSSLAIADHVVDKVLCESPRKTHNRVDHNSWRTI
jgi:L-2-hydroxyglutarate oxidase LhgO